MQVRHREVFTSIQTEGAILPPDLLQRVFSGDNDLQGLRPKDYHLAESEKLNEAINRSWNVLQGYWKSFKKGQEKLAETDPGTSLTRERWLLPLFQELGYGRLLTHKAIAIENKSYPISHNWGKTPIHLVGCKVDLDRRTAGVSGAARSSPHSLVQELLNRSDDHLWAFLSNGTKLRILRDNLSLTRQAYVEFDLETMMQGEVYSDFFLLWLLGHQSRVEAEKPEECWLEKWSQTAQGQGTRALDQLRNGVEDAIQALGSGFLKQPFNWALREKMKSGQLDKQDYYRQLLRLIYRLLFLFVAEDRDMLFVPDSDPESQELYIEHYSTTHLRKLAEKLRGSRHTDIFQSFNLIINKLSVTGCPELGLPALGSFLFSKSKAIPDLEISNEDFLSAIRALAFTSDQGTLRAVDYKNLGSEEFGSVYESLLELHPDLNVDAGTFGLKTASGHERKTTGSYYTPSSLVQCLLDSALDPVLDEASGRPDPEKAILDLKICDPACGSGHFLIAAAHRVARRLASIRTGDEEPSPEATRTALRDVIGHCVYGVDLNPMAVELCKVALWMESLDPGKPLSLLDHKMQCGNSLLGTTPKLLADGILNEAFKPIEGDDPKYCSVLRRRNEQERQGQLTMWASMVAESHATYGSLSDRYRSVDEMEDSSVKAVAEKEKKFDRLLQSADYQHSKLSADAWCASYVWPKQKNAPEPVTQDLFRQMQSPNLQPLRETIAEVHQLSEKYRFFHWHLAFPDVFRVPSMGESVENDETGWNGGFDVVLGNPPWEHTELKELEFFAISSPEIAKARTGAIRKRKINILIQKDPGLYRSFQNAKRLTEGTAHIIQASSRYPYCGRGRTNTYGIFTELNLSIVGNKGRVGCIVPSGLATDDTYKIFFRELMKSKRLVSFYDFENKGRYFINVHRNYKFCLLTLSGQSEASESQAKFLFFGNDPEDVRSSDQIIPLSLQEILMFNPNTGTCPIFRNRKDSGLALKVYLRIPILVKEGENRSNPWQITIRRIFNMGIPKVVDRCSRIPNRQEHETLFRMYESKLMWGYEHRHATYEGCSDSEKNKGTARLSAPEELADPNIKVAPRYWMPASGFQSGISNHISNAKWLLVFRDVTRAVDQRTVSACIIPVSATDFTLRVLIFAKRWGIYICGLLVNLNTFILDYLARQKIGGIHLSDFITKQLPILEPQIYDTDFTGQESLIKFISPRVLELTYTAWDLQDFASECGYEGPPFRWDQERRFQIRCELDALFFHLYLPTDKQGNWLQSEAESQEDITLQKSLICTPRNAVEYIMETFPIVKRKDLQKHGEYRTKLNILNIYDRIKHAIESDEPYQTLLDPPPADPSVAHLPKDGSRQQGTMWDLSDLLHSTPTESSIRVKILKKYLDEGIDSSGLAKFRILKKDEGMPRESQIVIVRHPDLRRGDQKIQIAAGKFYWAEQRDVETGKPFNLITIRTKGVPVKLKLTMEEWKQFHPFAVLEEG